MTIKQMLDDKKEGLKQNPLKVTEKLKLELINNHGFHSIYDDELSITDSELNIEIKIYLSKFIEIKSFDLNPRTVLRTFYFHYSLGYESIMEEIKSCTKKILLDVTRLYK